MEEKTLKLLLDFCDRLSVSATERERQALAVSFMIEVVPQARPFFAVGENGEELTMGGSGDEASAAWLNLTRRLLVLARDAAAGLTPAPVLEEQAFRVRLGCEVRRARRYKSVLCLISFQPRDPEAEKTWKALEAVRRLVRESDLVGRINGRMFVMLPATDRAGGEVAINRIMTMLRENASGEWTPRKAYFPYDGWTEDELLGKVSE